MEEHPDEDDKKAASALIVNQLIENFTCKKCHKEAKQDKRSPHIAIIEEPGEARFRYPSDQRDSGTIHGVSSTDGCATYPIFRVCNANGQVKIYVSCVYKNEENGKYRTHPHKMIGRNCKSGIFRTVVSGDHPVVVLKNVGIECVTKGNIPKALQLRRELNVDPFLMGFSHETVPHQPPVDLNALRLCVQALLPSASKGRKCRALSPVVTRVFYNEKLKIIEITPCSLPAGGGRVSVICEKITINHEVVFLDPSSDPPWEQVAKVVRRHKQAVAVVVAPTYRLPLGGNQRTVYIKLRRTDDRASSSAVPFTYTRDYTLEDNYIKNKMAKKRFDYKLYEQWECASQPSLNLSGITMTSGSENTSRNPFSTVSQTPATARLDYATQHPFVAYQNDISSASEYTQQINSPSSEADMKLDLENPSPAAHQCKTFGSPNTSLNPFCFSNTAMNLQQNDIFATSNETAFETYEHKPLDIQDLFDPREMRLNCIPQLPHSVSVTDTTTKTNFSARGQHQTIPDTSNDLTGFGQNESVVDTSIGDVGYGQYEATPSTSNGHSDWSQNQALPNSWSFLETGQNLAAGIMSNEYPKDVQDQACNSNFGFGGVTYTDYPPLPHFNQLKTHSRFQQNSMEMDVRSSEL